MYMLILMQFSRISLILRDADGEWFTYSFGGYHADDDERTVLEADNSGGPFFKSTPIDVHRFEMGKARQLPGKSLQSFHQIVGNW